MALWHINDEIINGSTAAPVHMRITQRFLQQWQHVRMRVTYKNLWEMFAMPVYCCLGLIFDILKYHVVCNNMNFKVHIFWEGHKILQNLPLTFDYSTYCYKQHGISICQVVIQENSKQALQTFLKGSYRQHACAYVVPLLKNSLSNAHVHKCRCIPVYDLIINELQRHLKH